MRKTLIATLLATSMPAMADIAAGTPEFKWTLPTKNVDGSTIPPSGTDALKEVRLYCDGEIAPVAAVAVPTLGWTAPLGTFVRGAHSCQATAMSNGGAESAKSNSVNFTMPASPPNTVENVSVQ